MPIYVYRCPECGEKYEILRDLGKAPKTQDCVCGNQAKRDYSAYGGFTLKGPGWPGKEIAMSDVISNEKQRDAEFKRRRKEARQDGADLPYWGDE